MDNNNPQQMPNTGFPQPEPIPTPQPEPTPVTPAIQPEPTPITPAQPTPATPTQQPAPATEQPLIEITSPTPTKKNKAPLIATILVIVILVVAAAIIIPMFLLNKGITVDTVRDYCQKNNMLISSQTISDDPKIEVLSCTSNFDIDAIGFMYSDVSLLENEDFKSEYLAYASMLGTTLEDSQNYKKYYMEDIYDTTYYTGSDDYSYKKATYFIIDNNTAITIRGKKEAIEKALIDFGYPDRNWGSNETTSENQNTSALSISQRDTQRRNDMSRLDTSLIQYQTNHSSQADNLPEGPSYWEGSETFDCDNNVACEFIENYMNNGATNLFEDPDGTLYSMYITDNIYNGAITTSLGDAKLSGNTTDGYSIATEFDNHIIYVIPGGMCDEKKVVKSPSKRHFAIMYQLEGSSGTYCIDDM